MAFINQITRRGLATSTAFNAKINEFVVIGGGLMGAGIAQVSLQKLESIHEAKFLVVPDLTSEKNAIPNLEYCISKKSCPG